MGDHPLDADAVTGRTHADLAPSDLAAELREARLAAFLRPPGAQAPQPTGELESLLARTAEVYSRAIAESTRADYLRRWYAFQQWCSDHHLASLPAAPETVMLYLSDVSRTAEGLALSTLRGRVSAISRVHLEAGLPSPSNDPAMTTFLRGLSRVVPPRQRPVQIKALRLAALRTICQTIEATATNPTEVRDRAILLLHDGGLSDAEIANLDWQQVQLCRRSLRLAVLSANQVSGPKVKMVASEDSCCPVSALQAWATLCEPVGRVFRLIEHGSPTHRPMVPKRVRGVRESRLRAFGHDGGAATPREAAALLGHLSSFSLRDKAMLLIGFAGAFRRNELTALRWADIREFESGLVVHLRRSKTDQEGRGCDVGIPIGKSSLTCPVRSLGEWRLRVLESLGRVEDEAPVFTHVTRPGRITNTPLTPEAVTMMIQRRTAEANLAGHWGGRSLRAGFISTAADLDIPLEAIARQSRHKTLDSLALYIRGGDPFRRNPAGKVGL